MFQLLFSPGHIGTLKLRNRLIMPAMGSGMQNAEGFVTERMYHYHRVRAAGGVGMDTVEIAAVHPTSGGAGLALWDDKYIPKLSDLVDVIHQGGAAACLQLWHAGRQTNSRLTGMRIVAPSPIPCPLCQEEPVELTEDMIKELVDAYASAAWRAKKAGFDAVEVHGAHGYLIAQFMSAYSNKREDEYGGPLENRARFAVEIIDAIRREVGSDYPIIYRLSGEEKVKDGLTIEDAKKIAVLMANHGVNAIHVSIGAYETLRYTVPPMDLPRGFNVWAAAEIKKVVNIPVIAVGRINDPALAEEIIAQGKADLVAIGRALLTDPQWPTKAKEGRIGEIRRCIACNQGCVDRLLLEGKHVTCILNPTCGREQESPPLSPANKKVVVVGGGLAGMEAARLLRHRGCKVTLFEASSTLGGQWSLAGMPPGKSEIKEDVRWLIDQMHKLQVTVKLNTPADGARILSEHPDGVIIATGAIPTKPDIDGINKPHVVLAADVLAQRVEPGQTVVIIGGGATGLETADYLGDSARTATVIEMQEDVGLSIGPARKAFLLDRLRRCKVRLLTSASVEQINDHSVDISIKGRRDQLPADTVVIATGYESNSLPMDELPKSLLVKTIGDAKEPRRATDAIYEAFCAVYDI